MSAEGNAAPVVLRIKRKRTEDPLQALLLEDQKLKRTKSSQYIFKLARTDERLDSNDKSALLEQDLSLDPSKKVFNVPKLKETFASTTEGATNDVNPELLDMVNEYLKLHDEKPTVKPPKRRQSQASNEKPVLLKDFSDHDDYVYDVYYRDKAVQESWEKDKIGYIRFNEDDADFLLNEEDEDGFVATDDEDSNAEDFYRNDYPEDEDGGYDISDQDSLSEEHSDDEDDIYDIEHDRSRFTQKEFLETEGLADFEMGDKQGLDRLYAQLGNQKSLLADNDMDGIVDNEDHDENAIVSDDDDSDYEIKRNRFFPNDEEDDLAMHRDKIFSKLQNMIDNN